MSAAALGLAALQAERRRLLQADLNLRQLDQPLSYKNRDQSKRGALWDTDTTERDQNRLKGGQDDPGVAKASRLPPDAERRGLAQLQRLHPTAVTLSLARRRYHARHGFAGGAPWHRPLPWERRLGDPQLPEQESDDEAEAATEARTVLHVSQATAQIEASHIPAAASSPSPDVSSAGTEAYTYYREGTQTEEGMMHARKQHVEDTVEAVQALRAQVWDMSGTNDAHEQMRLDSQLYERLSALLATVVQEPAPHVQYLADHMQLCDLLHDNSPDAPFAKAMFRSEPFEGMSHAAEMARVQPGLARRYPGTWGRVLRMAEAGDTLAACVLRQALCGALMLVGPWRSEGGEGGMELDLWACAELAPLVGLLTEVKTGGNTPGSQAGLCVSPHLLYQTLFRVPPTLVVRTAMALTSHSEPELPLPAVALEAHCPSLRFSKAHVETLAYCYTKAPDFLASVCKAISLDDDVEHEREPFMAATETCPGPFVHAHRENVQTQPAIVPARSSWAPLGSAGDGAAAENDLHRHSTVRTASMEAGGIEASSLTDELHKEAWSKAAASDGNVLDTEDGEQEECLQLLQFLHAVVTATLTWCNRLLGQPPAAQPTHMAAVPGDQAGGVSRLDAAAPDNPVTGSAAGAPAATLVAPVGVTVAGAEELWAMCSMFFDFNCYQPYRYLVFQPETVAAVTGNATMPPAPASGAGLPLQAPGQPQQQAAIKGRQTEGKAGRQVTSSTPHQAGEYPALTFSNLTPVTVPPYDGKKPHISYGYRGNEIARHETVVTANSKLKQAAQQPLEALVKKQLRMVFVRSQGVAGLVTALEVMVKIRHKLREEGRDMCVAVTGFLPQLPGRAADAEERSRDRDQDAGGRAEDADGSQDRLMSSRAEVWSDVHALCRTVAGAPGERALVESGAAAMSRMLAVLREECEVRRGAHVEFQLLECEPGRPWALVPPSEPGKVQGRAGGGGGRGKGGSK